MQLISLGDTTIDERKQATRYVRGKGIEIGASHMPIEVDKSCCNVTYVDRLSEKEIDESFPELREATLVPVDVRCDVVTEGLAPFEDQTLDFVIASHLLEHLPNPLSFLKECYRVLRVGGVLYLGLPDKDYTFDLSRERTPLAHLVKDFEADVKTIDEQHLVDYLVNAAKEMIPEDPEEKTKLFERELGRSFHVHVWTWEDMVQFLQYVVAELELSWELLEMYLPKSVKNEAIFILQRSAADSDTATARFASSLQVLVSRERGAAEVIRLAQEAIAQQLLHQQLSAGGDATLFRRLRFWAKHSSWRRLARYANWRRSARSMNMLSRIVSRWNGTRAGGATTPEPLSAEDGSDPFDRFRRDVPPDLLRTTAVTDRLFSRLDAGDIAAAEAAMTEDEHLVVNASSPADRKRLLLAYGVHYGIRGVLMKSGLQAVFPPDDVHAMSRGPHVTAGSCSYGDLIVDALRSAGAELSPGARGLDFGCSSGRVVRGLAAAYPEVEWHGCDPVTKSIKWAQEHLAGMHFAVSQSNPPLPYAESFFDVVFAISIWSHFSESAALRWLDEMSRVIRPGGRLILTTHGYQAVAYLAERKLYELAALTDIEAALYTRGYWFAPVINGEPDWGIVHPEWGVTFLTPEWLLANACPPWRVAHFAIGGVEGNQDIYTLERR